MIGIDLLWQEFMEYRKERGKMLLSRRNQLLLEFSFWNEPAPRQGPNIYELRSYQLRVRTDMAVTHLTGSESERAYPRQQGREMCFYKQRRVVIGGII